MVTHVVSVIADGWQRTDGGTYLTYELDDAGWERLKARLDARAINTETSEE
jgi:hypothetical protein